MGTELEMSTLLIEWGCTSFEGYPLHSFNPSFNFVEYSISSSVQDLTLVQSATGI